VVYFAEFHHIEMYICGLFKIDHVARLVGAYFRGLHLQVKFSQGLETIPVCVWQLFLTYKCRPHETDRWSSGPAEEDRARIVISNGGKTTTTTTKGTNAEGKAFTSILVFDKQ
jgi:hypothetical protein